MEVLGTLNNMGSDWTFMTKVQALSFVGDNNTAWGLSEAGQGLRSGVRPVFLALVLTVMLNKLLSYFKLQFPYPSNETNNGMRVIV